MALRVHGGFDMVAGMEDETISEFVVVCDMSLDNSNFKKRISHLITLRRVVIVANFIMSLQYKQIENHVRIKMLF